MDNEANQERDGPRHDLKVDPKYAFECIKVKSLADDYALNVLRQPKPDPLVEIMEVLNGEWTPDEYAKAIRAALGKLGFEIREKRK